MEDELAIAEESTLKYLERVETHWHWVKTGLISLSCLVTIAVVVYYNNRMVNEVQKNRNDLNCALLAFVPSNQDDSTVTTNIRKCVEKSQ